MLLTQSINLIKFLLNNIPLRVFQDAITCVNHNNRSSESGAIVDSLGLGSAANLHSQQQSSFLSSYATNPRSVSANSATKHVHRTLPPLENRNSAPEIVVGGRGGGGAQPFGGTLPPPRRTQSGLEERINRAKAKFGQLGVGTPSLGAVCNNNNNNNNNICHGSSSSNPKPKLSSRFHSAQKLNSRLLSNLSSAANGVKRSRTFNISDVQDELTNGSVAAAAAVAGSSSSSGVGSSRTLPVKPRIRKSSKGSSSQSSSMESTASSTSSSSSSSSSPDNNNGSGSSMSCSYDSSSTASSRKSSNSSNSAAAAAASNETLLDFRAGVSKDALEQIAAFEAFAQDYYRRQAELKMMEKDQKNPKNIAAATRKLSPMEIKDLVL